MNSKKVLEELRAEIALGWNGANSKMTIDQIIASKEGLKEESI